MFGFNDLIYPVNKDIVVDGKTVNVLVLREVRLNKATGLIYVDLSKLSEQVIPWGGFSVPYDVKFIIKADEIKEK